ncbi:MAG: acetyl-CoA acetyltransferase [Rectinemataceae bacterium]|jgi:acetyl-CoA C-acetyltransferase
MAPRIGIVGIGHCRFGNSSDYDLVDVIAYSANDALEDAGGLQLRKQVDQVFVGNMAAGMFNHQSAVASSLISRMDMEPCPAELVENGPASGASAVKLGYMAIASGMADVVLVAAGELMRTVSGWEATNIVATMSHIEAEYNMGLTLPGFAGMFTRLYMQRYGMTERDLALVAVKDHANGALNKYAHVQIPVTIDAIADGETADVVNNYVAEPLRMYSTCPISDGSAAVIMVNMDSPKARLFKKKAIRVAGIGSATDTHCVHNRKDPLVLDAVRLSSQIAYKMAGIGPKDISFAELHDAFVIFELLNSEEVGFFERGKSFLGVRNHETDIDGRIPINTSGGLKAKGHPVGATGVSQVVELVRQLRGEAEEGRQVKDPKYGMAVNFGGFGNNVITTILAKD